MTTMNRPDKCCPHKIRKLILYDVSAKFQVFKLLSNTNLSIQCGDYLSCLYLSAVSVRNRLKRLPDLTDNGIGNPVLKLFSNNVFFFIPLSSNFIYEDAGHMKPLLLQLLCTTLGQSCDH